MINGFLFLFLFLLPPFASADYYKCLDNNGNILFSDQKCPEDTETELYRIKEKSKTTAIRELYADKPSFRGLIFGVNIENQTISCPKFPKKLYPCFDKRVNGADGRVWMKDSLTPLSDYGVIINITNNVLSSLWFGFDTDKYNDITNVFISKYGPPISKRSEPWQSKGGVKTNSIIQEWKDGDMVISIHSLGSRIDIGRVEVYVPELIVNEKLEELRSVRKYAKDF